MNTRTDQYGGNIENRPKMAIEMANEITSAIGKDKAGIRFSPYSLTGDLGAYPEEQVHETYRCLTSELNKIGIGYIHIGVSAGIRQKTLDVIRNSFHGTIILCNGLPPETGEEALNNGFADIVEFGRCFLANPDFDIHIAKNAALNQADYTTLY